MRLLPLILLAACASPDTIRPFALNPNFEERLADPGKVDLACYDEGGRLDSGSLKQWNDSYCGCVDLAFSVVWISRYIHCDIEKVRKHENCHIETGARKEARAKCAKDFPTRA